MEERVTFIGTPVTSVFSGDNFRIYGVEVNRKIVKDLNLILDERYHTLTITGDLPDLTLHTEYKITAIQTKTKRGISYKVYKICKERPTTIRQSRKYLEEVLTPRQADILLTAYPNIIEMVINNEPVDLNKTSGIKGKTFAKIKKKIIEEIYLMELIDEFSEFEMSLSMLKKLHEKYTSVDRIKEMMKNDPYKCLCGINRIGFKTADKLILKAHKEFIKSDVRMTSCMLYILGENEKEGNTWIDKNEFKTKCEELTPQCIDCFEDLILTNKDIHIKENKIAKEKTYYAEYYIAEAIVSMLRKPRIWNIDYKKYGIFDDNILTDQQINILKQICENNICLLAGYSGCGKSFSTQAVIKLLDDNKKKYILLAPTGRASKVLASYTKKPASTIHRGLKYNSATGWGYNESNKLDVDFVICDESSMVDVFLMKSLFEAIDINRTKILFIFDPEQIPSVSCGKVAYDMLESGIINNTILTKIFRFGEGGLYNISFKIRNGESYINNNFRGIKNFGTNKDYSIISVNQESTVDYVKKLYLRLINHKEKIEDILITCALNVGNYGCNNINKIIQELINPRELGKPELKLKERVFRLNDRVMQICNNYKAINGDWEQDTIFNGDISTIIDITNKEVFVKYDEKVIIYEKSELEQIQLAYAVNIYKLQGSQCSNIIIVTPKSHTYFLNKNLIYTGVTRAKKRVYHICTPDVINFALKKSANYNRNTFLKDLLIEMNN